MPRCIHHWEPLVKIDTAGMSTGAKFAVAFALKLQHLDDYDRCALCGRISYLARSRRHPRKLVSCDTSRIEQRAVEFEQWAERQKTDLATPPSAR